MTNIGRSVLFVHDGPIYFEPTTKKYYGVHYNNNLLKRYSFFGNHLSFLMRLKKLLPNEVEKYSPLNSPSFSFIEIPNFKSISTYKNKSIAIRIIKNAVKSHDLIIVRLPSASGAIAYKQAQNIKRPILVEFVACVFDALWNYDWKGKLLAHYKFYAYKKLIKNSSHTIYVTNQFLQSRYPTKGKWLSCSDVEIVIQGQSAIEKRLFKIQQNNKFWVMGTIAALDVPYKGQADVIKALVKLKKQGIYIKYKLVGQGNSSNLRRVINKYKMYDLVEIIGPLSHTEINNFLEEIDIYIQPSKQEGLPRSLIEAMSKACPSLGAKTAGIPELLQEECIFEAGNINQIVTKLKEINLHWMQVQAELNFETAKEYQLEALENRRKAFYQEFLVDCGFKER